MAQEIQRQRYNFSVSDYRHVNYSFFTNQNYFKMKKKETTMLVLALVAIFTGLLFSGCEKEGVATQSSSIQTLKEKGVLDIKMQDGMLCFDSWEQYENTIYYLAESCENHVAHYYDSICSVTGTADEEVFNMCAERDGFSQFKPLHDFSNALNFQSLYNVLEAEEIKWLEESTDSLSPFETTLLERYQSALHNVAGDVMIAGKVFNPDKAVEDDCKMSGSVSGMSSIYTFNNKTRFLKGKLSTTAIYFCANTTAYTKKSRKNSLWLTRGLGVSDGGNKLHACETVYYNDLLMPMQGKSTHRPNLPLCYVFVFKIIHQIPNYIHPYAQLLHSYHWHSLSGTSFQLAL